MVFINKNLSYLSANTALFKNGYQIMPNSKNLSFNSIQGQSVPTLAQPNYFYNYSVYKPQNSSIDINNSMKSQFLSPTVTGYREIGSFDAPFLDKGKLYKLDNGQNVVIIPKKGPTTIKTFTKVGSFNEAKNRGISHYIEHNLFNGSKNLGPNEFVEKVISMGGQYNASTNTTNTDYYIKSPLHKETDFEQFINMHADMLQNPKFTEPTLDKEKGVVISEIRMYEDDPGDKAFNLMLKNLFGIKANYQGLIAGSSENIANLTKKDVLDYYNEWYRPENMTTVVVGEVDPGSAIKIISKAFNQKKTDSTQTNKKHFYEPIKLTNKPIRADFSSERIDAVMLNMAFAGPQNNNLKDTVATTALCTALTGYENARLNKTLKEFNTAGAIDLNVINPAFEDPQLIGFASSFTPGSEEKGLNAVYSTLHEMKTKPLNNEEMFIVKNKLKDNFTQISESSMGVANIVGQSITGNGSLKAYTDFLKEVEKLSPQDIQAAAQKYLDLNKVSIVMVHPEIKNKTEGTTGNQSKNLGFQGNTDRFKMTNIKEYSLANNLQVAINDDPSSIRTSAILVLQTDKPIDLKPGVADILSIMMNKGTKNYSEEQLNNIRDKYNLGVSIGTDADSVSIITDCAKEKIPMALVLMKEMLYNADLTPDKFLKAKEELKVQLASIHKNPADRAMEMLFPDHPWGNTTRKVKENIDNVTLNDVKNLYIGLLNQSQGKIAIDGPISKTPGLGQAIFNELQTGIQFNKKFHYVPGQESIKLNQPVVITETEKRNQADIVQIYKIKASKNIQDKAALFILNEILGGNSESRLFTDLRESQKLAYKVKSQYLTDGNYSTLKLLIKTTTEDDIKGPSYQNVQKSLEGFKKHVNNLMTIPVRQKELETAKLAAKTHFLEDTESSLGRSARVMSGYNTVYGVNYHNQLIDAINNTKPEDIQRVAKVFLNQPSVVSLIASPNTLKYSKSYLNTLGKVENYPPSL